MPPPLLWRKPPLTRIGDKTDRVSAMPRYHALLLRHVCPVVRKTSGCSTRCGARSSACKKEELIAQKKDANPRAFINPPSPQTPGGSTAKLCPRTRPCRSRAPESTIARNTTKVAPRGCTAGALDRFSRAKWRLFYCLRPPWSSWSRGSHHGMLWGSPSRKTPPLGVSNRDCGPRNIDPTRSYLLLFRSSCCCATSKAKSTQPPC